MIGRSVGLIGVCFCISGCGLVLDLDPGDDAGLHMDAGSFGLDATAADAGSGAADAGAVMDGGVSCGAVVCPIGMTCCNASCGVCTVPGEGCIDIACLDGGPALPDAAVVDAGVSCGAVCGPTETCCDDCDGGSSCVSAPDSCPTCVPACRSSDECASTEFCERTAGGCSGSGTCTARPSPCADDCPGVCGCDGEVYCNACQANAAGVSVTDDSALCPRARCAPMRVITNGGATPDRFAWTGDQCSTFRGECAGLDCGDLFMTLDLCQDAMASCTCGGITASLCGADEYCEYTLHCCDLDASGICRPRPDPASCSMTPDAPVSGCDGHPYANACLAHAAGVDARPPGMVCPATP